MYIINAIKTAMRQHCSLDIYYQQLVSLETSFKILADAEVAHRGHFSVGGFYLHTRRVIYYLAHARYTFHSGERRYYKSGCGEETHRGRERRAIEKGNGRMADIDAHGAEHSGYVGT